MIIIFPILSILSFALLIINSYSNIKNNKLIYISIFLIIGSFWISNLGLNGTDISEFKIFTERYTFENPQRFATRFTEVAFGYFTLIIKSFISNISVENIINIQRFILYFVSPIIIILLSPGKIYNINF